MDELGAVYSQDARRGGAIVGAIAREQLSSCRRRTEITLALRAQEVAAIPEGLAIETIRDEAGLKAWVDVWLGGAPAEIRPGMFEVLRQRGLGDDLPWRFFLGRLDGEPAATSELFIGEGVAGVQHVVTLPEQRRRGIGRAMTLHVLRDAQAMGYRVAVLTASPDGIGIYRRLGFREYCWFRRYEQARRQIGGNRFESPPSPR